MLDTTTHPAAAIRTTLERTRRLEAHGAAVRITLGIDEHGEAAIADLVVYHHDEIGGPLPDEIIATATVALPAGISPNTAVPTACNLARRLATVGAECMPDEIDDAQIVDDIRLMIAILADRGVALTVTDAIGGVHPITPDSI